MPIHSADRMRPDVLSAVAYVSIPGKKRPITVASGTEDPGQRRWDGALLRSLRAFPFSEVVIEMKGGSRRHLASMARRLLTTPAARAGKVTRWLRRSAPRAGPLTAAA